MNYLELLISAHKNPPPRTYVANPPARSELLSELPAALRSVYALFDGGLFFNYKDLDGFRFLRVSEIPAVKDELAAIYEEAFDPSFNVFCEILGEGNYIALGSSGRIYDAFHEVDPAQWTIVAQNVDEWLQQLVALNGEKYWLNGPRNGV